MSQVQSRWTRSEKEIGRALEKVRVFLKIYEPGTRIPLFLWRGVVEDNSLLPPPGADEEEDAIILRNEAYVDGPIKVDYGTNLRLGKGVNTNCNCTFLDTCLITIGARTLIGPNCSFFSATHPLDPFQRNGIQGPELGASITVGEDCWFGGNATVCPGVTIGRGVTVGAGSVVTKDVPAFHLVAGNPARIIRKIEPEAPDPAMLESGHDESVFAIAEGR
ncbi:MAG: hypothetical protein M1818_004967 [Claussenomyces sp. TS43310]|nr:MAG: hypothetical protein M1818_004967 [Claussenomyces sp. TS43310]